MDPRIALLTYRTIQYLRGEKVIDALADLEGSQWESHDRIKDLQWRKLVRIVEHAYEHVPYYKSIYDSVGFEPRQLKDFRDLKLVPIIGKDVMRNESSNLIATDKHYRFSQDTTSGSSGPTTVIYTDRTALAYQHAASFRAYRWMGLDIGQRLVRFWGTQLDRTRRVKNAARDSLLNRRTFSTHGLDHESLGRYYREFVKFQPAAIYGFTSGVYEFADFIRRNDLSDSKINVTAIVVTGEPLFTHQREAIESVFQCKVFNEYGCAEFGPVAYECPHETLHINAENVLVELEKGDSPDGGRGNLVMTELNNAGMPMIRYRMGDVGVLSNETCKCGRGLPILEEISGRLLDFVRTTDGKKVHGIYFDYLPKYFIGEIHQFQIVQDDLRYLTIRIVKDSGFNDSTIAKLEKQMRSVVGENVEIKFTFESKILPERTGKHRLVVSSLDSFSEDSAT
jgi:phenylacetate-CoA ligase